MNRKQMLRKLQAIKEPLVSLTVFCDGVTCEYMSSKGCGGFELLDWSDLDEHDYDAPDQAWEYMNNEELEKWINNLVDGSFNPLKVNSQ